MQKALCERKGHQRLTWALNAALFTGVGLGASIPYAMPEALDGLVVLFVLMSGFSFGVYVGVIKLDTPKRKPKVASPEAKPPPQSTKE